MLTKDLGIRDYQEVFNLMRKFTLERPTNQQDELWVLEHFPVFTLGINTNPEHLPKEQEPIPLVQSDRGGQITYHGPGQLIAYPLLDLKRIGIKVKELVTLLESTVILLLNEYGHESYGEHSRRGVYVEGKKIASLGLKIRNGFCYHGVALNVNLDLTPFRSINPCGYPNLEVTSMTKLGISDDLNTIKDKWIQKFVMLLSKN